jgi:prepilin-type N-terminal cleavage/methylation domain-containing protein
MVLRTASNDKGYSLIEVLIALFLAALVFAGLLKSSLLVMNTNLENLLRDEATSVADQQMTQVKNTPFNTLPSVYTQQTTTTTRSIRGMTTIAFVTTQTVNPLDVNNKSVTIQVSWTRNGQTRIQTYATLMRYKP